MFPSPTLKERNSDFKGEQIIKLPGKTVYITGGSSGIGLETAKQVASLGAHVVIFARNQEKLETARQEIESMKINNEQIVAAVSLDVTDNEGVESTMRKTVGEKGDVSIFHSP